jgi:hypothetical protein
MDVHNIGIKQHIHKITGFYMFKSVDGTVRNAMIFEWNVNMEIGSTDVMHEFLVNNKSTCFKVVNVFSADFAKTC